MIIRSQDKRKIINFNQITHIATMFNSRLEQWKINVCYPYCNDAECGYSTIAYYSTEEKAIKVLDMICEHAEALHFSKVAPNECGQIWGNVFNVPQDSEV